MTRAQAALAAGFAALLLAGCNTSGGTDAPPASAYRVPGVTPAGFTLPQGEGCAAEIARFEAILSNDLNSGHVSQQVYNQIKVELGPARAACVAGKEAEARSLVAASRRRHGYPS